MPFYEYRCKQCGNVRILQMSIKSDPEKEIDCDEPDCDGKCVRLFPKKYNLKFIGDGFMSNNNLAEYWD
ncbi:MAG: zinc ribbon domain-containing protein [Candidatus Marinimicrobia bacterium]|nr:zinc ribbon domain-containing protein [Candidatus Neomarinimicrobiota bacterium]